MVVDQLLVTNRTANYAGVFNFNYGTLTTLHGSIINLTGLGDGLRFGTTPQKTNVWNILGGTNVVVTDSGFDLYLGTGSKAPAFMTVSGPSTVLTNTGGIYVGLIAGGCQLAITNGAKVQSSFGALLSSTSSVLVVGTGSRWDNGGTITLNGERGVLSVRDGATVTSTVLDIAPNPANSNDVTVTGSNTALIVSGVLSVGGEGKNNSVIISNGGALYSGTAYVSRFNNQQSGNRIVVTGPGSYWTNQSSISFLGIVQDFLTVKDGAKAVCGSIALHGGSNSLMSVTGTGSTWLVTGSLQMSPNSQLMVGGSGLLNVGSFIGAGPVGGCSVTLTNGGTLLTPSFNMGGIGVGGFNVSNRVTITEGSLAVTNSTQDAALDLYNGILSFNTGTLTVDGLFVTNPASSFGFTAGTLSGRNATIANSNQFIVGDGTSVATYRLVGGVHSFADSLRISSNALLAGCGTINGAVVVAAGGTVLADCSPLVFSQSVTNNGTMVAINGSALEVYGNVVNNGIINVIHGATNFHGAFINNGIVLDANGDYDGDGLSNLQEDLAGTDPTNSVSSLRITDITTEGDDVRVTWMTAPGKTNALDRTAGDASGGYTTNFADIFIVTNSVSSVTNYLDIGAATNSPSRYYRVRLVP